MKIVNKKVSTGKPPMGVLNRRIEIKLQEIIVFLSDEKFKIPEGKKG